MCGVAFERHPKHSHAQWEEKRACSRKCRVKMMMGPCPGCGDRVKKHASSYSNPRPGLQGLCEPCYRERLIHKTYGECRPYAGANGYLYRHNPSHATAFKNGDVLVHREVWYDANGPIPDGYHVHHINGDKLDNRLENLELLSASEHAKRHRPLGSFQRNQHGGGVVRH